MTDSHPKVRTIRILLVDDYPLIRQGTRCILEAHPSIEVVGEASDGEEALVCVEKVQPTVVVMDVVMPRMGGIAATRLIKTQYPQIAVVGFVHDLQDCTVNSLKTAGASEVVDKQNAAVELYDAIQRALAGIDGKAADWSEIGLDPRFNN
jgi:two-component system response regulator DegU